MPQTVVHWICETEAYEHKIAGGLWQLPCGILVHRFLKYHILNVTYNEMTIHKVFLGCLVIIWSLMYQAASPTSPSRGCTSLPQTSVISQDVFQIWKGLKASLTLKSIWSISLSQWLGVFLHYCSTLNDTMYKGVLHSLLLVVKSMLCWDFNFPDSLLIFRMWL